MSTIISRPFVHLHNHSDFSLLDASTTVDELAKTAKAMGQTAIALTDHGNMMGVLHFQKACQKAGVKPIIGCEVYVADGSRHDKAAHGRGYFHLVLLAKNEIGYHNLLKLTSLAYIEGFYRRPRVDDELLAKYSEGLIASSACLGGEISTLLLARNYEKAKERALFYNQLFGADHYYLEIQKHGFDEDKIVCDGMVRLSAETGIPLVATNDIHYLKKEDSYDHHVFLCIGSQKTVDESNRGDHYRNCYFRSSDEMYELFSSTPDALTNSQKIADMCDFIIKEDGPLLPDYAIPDGYSNSKSYFEYLIYKGLTDRYGTITDKLKKRADFEIDIIVNMNFVGYFLIVWDFIDWAKKNDISVGPGRGSGAGSIVAYALKITDIDPIKYNLLFERFLNPERVSMPDFDIDFNDERRDEVIDYITQKYGEANVAGITTYSTLQTKAVLKDVARVLAIQYDESLAITKAVSSEAKNVMDAVAKSPDLQAVRAKGGIYEKLFEVASHLEGRIRGIGMHACGKVIAKSAVSDFVPLVVDNKTKVINTAFESTQIENCGLVKMDFLGLTTLSIIDRTVALVHQIEPDFNIDTIDEADKKTFELFCAGKTDGIFQFESEGMQNIMKDSKPSNIEDLIALNALYRPGPMQFIPDFVKGKHNPEKVKYFHESLVEVLKPTYGVIVYQEQVMQVAQIYAGYTLGGADILRRIMGKKKPEEMAKQKELFVEGAVKQGHSESEGAKLFEILEPFAGYGFNKSHAAAYSVLAYKTAYLKAHYPAQFMAANLTKNSGTPSSFRNLLDETRAMGVSIKSPNINKSGRDFSVIDGNIYYGFLGLKGVGEAAINEILKKRNEVGSFSSFSNFLETITMQSVNKATIEALIKAGMFDAIESHNRGTLLHNSERLLEYMAGKRSQKEMGPSLFGDDQMVHPAFVWEEVEDLSTSDKLKFEKEIAGFYISGHPFDKYRDLHKRLQNINLLKLDEIPSKMMVRVVGVFQLDKQFTTKNGLMQTATIEDFDGTIALVFFNDAYEKFKDIMQNDTACVIKGTFKNDRGEQIVVNDFQLADNYDLSTADTLKKVDEVVAKNSNPSYESKREYVPQEKKAPEVVVSRLIKLILKDELISKDNITVLKEFLLKNSGNDKVVLCWQENGNNKELRLKENFNIDYSACKDLVKTHNLIKEHQVL